MPRGSFGADSWIAFVYPLNTLDWETLGNGCHTLDQQRVGQSLPEPRYPGHDARLPSADES